MKTVFLLLLVVLLTTFSIYAEIPLPQVVEITDQFTIRLPENWVQIPCENLKRYDRHSGKSSKEIEEQYYNYGFQNNKTKEWYSYPCILIRVIEDGKHPESEVESLPEVRGGFEESGGIVTSVISQMEEDKIYYDSSYHILWTKIKAGIKPVGKQVKGVMALILTERGMIEVEGYAPESEYNQYAPLLEAIVYNLTVAKGIEYQPKTGSLISNFCKNNWKLIFLLICSSILGILSKLMFRDKKKARNY